MMQGRCEGGGGGYQAMKNMEDREENKAKCRKEKLAGIVQMKKG